MKNKLTRAMLGLAAIGVLAVVVVRSIYSASPTPPFSATGPKLTNQEPSALTVDPAPEQFVFDPKNALGSAPDPSDAGEGALVRYGYDWNTKRYFTYLDSAPPRVVMVWSVMGSDVLFKGAQLQRRYREFQQSAAEKRATPRPIDAEK